MELCFFVYLQFNTAELEKSSGHACELLGSEDELVFKLS